MIEKETQYLQIKIASYGILAGSSAMKAVSTLSNAQVVEHYSLLLLKISCSALDFSVDGREC